MATNMQVPASDPFALSLPQREEAFTVTSFTGQEAVGELYRILVHVMVDEGDESLSTALLGQPASLLIQNDGATVRAIHGVVAHVQSHGVMLGGRRAYSLTIVPSFWRLKRRRTRRIFQAMTTLDIASQLLGEWNVASRLAVQRELTKRAYTVQYDETDFAFLVRLFAEDGLLYFFEHLVLPPDGQGETLVLADGPGDFSPIEGEATLHFHRDPGSQIREDMVTWFANQTSVRSSRTMVRGYDFQRPDVPLGDDAASADATDGIDVVYEHEGSYEQDLGPRPAQARLDHERAKAQRVFGASFCRRLVPGTTFDLIEHEDASLDRDFVVTQIEHEGYAPGSAPPGRVVYQNRFRCAPADVSVRPAHKPLKPNQVAESAVVVGPADQEIYTDEFGRVKVQFPWDLEGQNDERSSCWLRVVQAWAGAGWGAQFIPRVGMEVIVTFLGGDLDRPIITGCVYNATHPPPFKLPEEKTRSGFRTSSTPDNQGANELSFEDDAGGEQIFLHAQRDHDEVVENDQTSKVGGNRSSDVAGTSSDSVGRNASLDVVGDRFSHIGGDDASKIDGSLSDEIRGDKLVEVHGDFGTTVLKTHSLEVRGNRALVVGEPDATAQSDHYVYGSASFVASERIIIKATQGLIFQCGDASIELSNDKIILKAPTVEISPSKSLECSTAGGPSVTLGEDVEILTKKFRMFTEAAALEVDKDFKVKGTSIKLGYDPSAPTKEKEEVEKATKPFECKFSDYFLSPYKNKKYHLMVDGLRFENDTTGEGVVKEDIPEDAKQVVVRLWLDQFPEGRQRLYTLNLVDLPPSDAVTGAKVRLNNLGYFLGNTDDPSVTDELRAAVSEFQDDHKGTHGLEPTGEYDAGTAGALEEVHGS